MLLLPQKMVFHELWIYFTICAVPLGHRAPASPVLPVEPLDPLASLWGHPGASQGILGRVARGAPAWCVSRERAPFLATCA